MKIIGESDGTGKCTVRSCNSYYNDYVDVSEDSNKG